MLPVQRQTRTQGRNRRSHDAYKPVHAASCPNCGSPRLSHTACNQCGYVRPGLSLNLSKKD